MQRLLPVFPISYVLCSQLSPPGVWFMALTPRTSGETVNRCEDLACCLFQEEAQLSPNGPILQLFMRVDKHMNLIIYFTRTQTI